MVKLRYCVRGRVRQHTGRIVQKRPKVLTHRQKVILGLVNDIGGMTGHERPRGTERAPRDTRGRAHRHIRDARHCPDTSVCDCQGRSSHGLVETVARAVHFVKNAFLRTA